MKNNSEHHSGLETSDEPCGDDVEKKHQSQDILYDDASTCGFDGEQDGMDQCSASLAVEEEDPDRSTACGSVEEQLCPRKRQGAR